MLVAIRDVTLYQAGLDDLRVGLEALGLGSVEVALSRGLRLPAPQGGPPAALAVGAEQEREGARAAYREAGVEICALFVANNFNAPEPGAEVQWAAQAVRIAEALGVGVVRLDGAMSGPERLSRRERVALYAAALGRVLEATADSAVALAVENHGRQGNDLLWLHELLERVDSPRVGLTLDPANLYWAGYPLEEVYQAVESLAPRTQHVHAKNVAYPEVVRQRRRPLGWEYGCCVCPLEAGDLDYGRLVGALAAAGYRGAVALEEEALAKFPPAERISVLRRDVCYLQQAVAGAGRGSGCG